MELQLETLEEKGVVTSLDEENSESSDSSIILLSTQEQLECLENMKGDILAVAKTVKRKPVYSFVKRLFDIVASLVALILLSPVLIIVAEKIKKESDGPAIFKQLRVGKNGKVFTMYKFRSMYIDAEERLESVLKLNKGKNALMFKAEDDPRITPFGSKIRKSSIDELPQLFNILKGEMSFVGPRPPLVREVIQYKKEQTIRLAVIGGLTCFWQVTGRNDADFDFCVEQDTKYIKERSWWTDIKLIFLTAIQVFGGSGS